MTDIAATDNLPVWGIDLVTGRTMIIGYVHIDRMQHPTAYTAQHDDEERTFPNETAAAYWIAQTSRKRWELCVIGRVFSPEALRRPSTSEATRGARVRPSELGTSGSALAAATA